jgi:hypothetical protein
MAEAKQLSTDISAKMDELLRSAGEAGRSGDIAKSIELSLQAWSLMPEPANQWDFYPQIMATNIVKNYAALGDAASARAWVTTAYALYNDPDRQNHYILMLEGAALHQMDLLDDAYAVFDRIYELFGKAGFRGDGKAYVDFYQSRKNSK